MHVTHIISCSKNLHVFHVKVRHIFQVSPPDILWMGRADNIDSTGCHNGSLDYTGRKFLPQWLQVFADNFRQAEKLIYESARDIQSMNKIVIFFCVGIACWNFADNFAAEMWVDVLTQCSIFSHQICPVFRCFWGMGLHAKSLLSWKVGGWAHNNVLVKDFAQFSSSLSTF